MTPRKLVSEKNAKLDADIESGEKVERSSYKKVINIKVNEFVVFHLLLLWAKVLSTLTFPPYFFNGYKSA
jgi:hypothetical protein